MAVKLMDSFDWSNTTSEYIGKWDAQTGTSIATGRFGSGLQFSNRSNRADKNGLGAHSTWIFGLAANGRPGTHYVPIVLFDGTVAGTAQVSLILLASGIIQVCAGNAGTVLASSSLLIPAAWCFIEAKLVVANSGSAIVKVNGVEYINSTGIDTQQSANATADSFRIGQAGSSSAMSFIMDDFYVLDGSGAAPTNDLIGDCRVETIMPSGNGNSSQFDGSDGNQTDNYLLVDEIDADDDTTYVESPDVNDKDTYAYANLATTAGTVYAINIQPRHKKTTAGTRSIATVARHSTNEVDSSAIPCSTDYVPYMDIRESKPGGGTWSISDVNGAEFGVKVVA